MVLRAKKAESKGRLGTMAGLLKKILKWMVLATLIAGTAGTLVEAALGFRDARRFPPPGKLYDIGGYRLHLNCVGEGSPTVILEAGLGRDSLDWSWVQPGLAEASRVCSYDRAGSGWSDPGPLPRDSASIASELRKLLDRANIRGPLVLVGHSAGGSHIRLFEHAFPNEVVGMVLVDVSHLKSPQPPPKMLVLAARALRTMGIMRGLGFLDSDDLPADVLPAANAIVYRGPFLSTLEAENTDAAESLRQVQALGVDGVLGDLPLWILTAGRPVEKERLPPGMSLEYARNDRAKRQEKQQEMLKMSSRSRQIIAYESGHQIQKDQPELIIETVSELVEELRSSEPGWRV